MEKVCIEVWLLSCRGTSMGRCVWRRRAQRCSCCPVGGQV